VAAEPSTTRPARRTRRRRPRARFDALKAVPASRADRDALRNGANAYVADLGRDRPPTEDQLVRGGRAILAPLGLDETHLAYAMVMVNNAFWIDQFRATPVERRMLLLPRCLRNIHGHEPRTDAAGINDITVRAHQLGYRTLVADGTPIVVKTLAEEETDAILGVACMDSLESAFDKVRHLGVPAVAVPLLNGNCKDTATDLDLVADLLEADTGRDVRRTRSYLPLFRTAFRLFDEPDLAALVGETGSPGEGAFARLAADTPAMAMNWIRRGGKRLRPFVTLAGYRALAPDGDIPPAVRRVAVAIEAFHKASLVHDDIEDDDAARYGQPTLHRQVGVDAAINVGDYLLGLGYRLIASAGPEMGEATAAVLVRLMSEAHVRLARGQGAELAWRRNGHAGLTLADVLKMYAWKTAPAFEAALASGLCLGGNGLGDLVHRFCRYVGVAFQVLNDIQDWESDLIHRRPTVLPVLAPADADLPGGAANAEEAQRVGRAFEDLGVFDMARELVERFRARALRLAHEAQPPALGDLLLFLTEIILRDATHAAGAGCQP